VEHSSFCFKLLVAKYGEEVGRGERRWPNGFSVVA